MTDRSEGIKRMQTVLNQRGAALAVDGDYGPSTEGALMAELSVKVLPVAPGTKWMDWIMPHIGEKEIYGSKDNPFIMGLYPYGSYPQQHDEVPWCACLVNAALISTGFKGTRSAAAASFAKYGTACEFKYGAVICIRHASGGNHVTFFKRWVDEKARIAECLGGNQANALKVSTYNLSGNAKGHDEVIGCRWPVA